jgi:hypothetical protein
MWLLMAVAEVVSLGFAVVLWREPASWLRRLIWTPLVLIPVSGPLFYLGFFDPPPPLPEAQQLRRGRHRYPTPGGR